ncbi:cadherin-like beta sandwich domain-containing protein [Roseimarinus sediminis]|uniref:cadherin-like beta sandwich domain-containing protein n=1 Tax=Roseimarinus sediminis TaxID=1610899 RepID=UPI003D1C15B1
MKLLALICVLVTAGLFNVNQAQEWNISSDAFNALGDITETVTVDGLTIYASADKKVTVDANNKSVGDLSFTHRLKLGGSGSLSEGVAEARVVAFDVDGNSSITVAAMSSSSSADRELLIVNAGTGDTLAVFPAMGAALGMETYEYTGDATTIYMYSPSSGVNVYYVKAEAAGPAETVLTHSYTFEDGTAADVVGGLDGTLHGEKITIADGKCTVSGASAKTDGYISLDAAALALNTYNAITIEAYLETFNVANSSYTMLAYFGNNTGGNKCFWIQPTRNGNETRIETNNGTSTKTAALSGTELDDGKLHHVVAILSPDALKYYIDGVLVAETATEGDYISTLDNQVANIFKGADSWGDPNYNVSLETFNIYNGELDEATILESSLQYLGGSDARLASLSVDGKMLYPEFKASTFEYVVPIEEGTTSATIAAEAMITAATVTGTGVVDIQGSLDTAIVSVVSQDETTTLDYTIIFRVVEDHDFVPLYADLDNIIPDPEMTDVALYQGWGKKAITYTESYSGLSSMKFNATTNGWPDGAALDVNPVAWEANSIYRVRVMYKTLDGSVAMLAKGSSNIFLMPMPHTNGEWVEIDTTFQTGNNPGSAFISINNVDAASTGKLVFIDNWELYKIDNVKNVAYVTLDKEMTGVGATQPDNDPIIQMLKNDKNIKLDVKVVAADSVFDLSTYDAVVVQESFGSSVDILKPGGTLGMANIPVPFVYNKVFAMKSGRGFTSGDGSGGEQPYTLYMKAGPENQANALFNGITFDGDSVQLIKTVSNDAGDGTGDKATKALQYAVDVPISVENTLLANGVNDPANVTVFINDIPAGASIGSETLQARMITLAMNFGAISKDGGDNLTDAGLTLWRNAVYAAAGLDIPAYGISNSAAIESITASAGKLAYDSNADAYQLTLPRGTSSATLSVQTVSKDAVVTLPAINVANGETKDYEIVVTAPVGETTMTYPITVHRQAAIEILYVSGGNGVYSASKAFDTNVYDALVEAGYSVTLENKLALNVEGFDYTPYAGLVIGGGVGSSWVNSFAKDGYPVPCVSMQNDGPKNNKWGWINDKNAAQFKNMKGADAYDVETAKMKILNNQHPITAEYSVDQMIQWTLGTADSADWAGQEIKSYNLSDSIPEAIQLATIPAKDGSLYPTMWAVPAGTSVRSLQADNTYARVETGSNVVLMYLFNNGLLYASDDFGALLTKSLNWAMTAGVEVAIDELTASVGTLNYDSNAEAYSLVLPAGTASAELSATVANGVDVTYPTINVANGATENYEIVASALGGVVSKSYPIEVHTQAAGEILYVSGGNGVYSASKAFDTNVYDALVEAGYSVTMANKLALNVEGFDYTPYAGLVIGGGVGSSWVNSFAKDGYPVPCVSMQNDGPKNNKWGWINDKNAAQFKNMKGADAYDVETAKMKILNNQHPITAEYSVDQMIQWTLGTADSADWAGQEIKSYNLSDSIPEAIQLATIPAKDGSLYPTMWAVPAGTSVRSLQADNTYARVETGSNVVLMYLFNNGLLYASDDFDALLTKSLDWAINSKASVVEEGVYYNIVQKNSNLVIGADTDPVTQPAVMTATGANDQAFQFIPVEGKTSTFYIKNAEGMYLNKAGTDNWTTLLSADINGLLSEWVLNGTDLSSVTFQIVDNLVNISAAKSYLSTNEAASGENLYCDKPAQAVGSNGEFMLVPVEISGGTKKLAYVTYNKEMDATAVQPDNDPIIQMMKNYPEFEMDVMVVSADSVFSLDGYDLVVVQEGFSSGAAVFTPGHSLALANFKVPFVYNKSYALRNGKAVVSGGGTSGEIAGTAISVPAASQSHELYSGITFTDNAFNVFRSTAADNGSAGTKALNYTYGLTISDAGTLIATATEITDASNVVFVNDIPAGTVVGDQTLQARMIAICQNFGAISANDGKNMTDEGLTMWRNAIFMAAGLEAPDTLYSTGEVVLSSDATLATLTVSAGELSPAFAADVTEYTVNVPTGTTSVDVAATANHAAASVSGTGSVTLPEGGTSVDLVVTAEDGSTKTYKVTFTIGVGFGSYGMNLALYPNPASQVLNISGSEIKHAEVFNLSGAKMKVTMLSNSQLDVSELERGSYVLRVYGTNQQVAVLKFNKQ